MQILGREQHRKLSLVFERVLEAIIPSILQKIRNIEVKQMSVSKMGGSSGGLPVLHTSKFSGDSGATTRFTEVPSVRDFT